MKKEFLICFLFLQFLLSGGYSQILPLSVNCGRDTFFCESSFGRDTAYIGSQVEVKNGFPPYRYSWSCDSVNYFGVLIFYAGSYVSDTSSPNPYLKGVRENMDWKWYLTVRDSMNNSASDTIIIRCSRYVASLVEYDFWLHEGDSLQFYDGFKVIGGGFPPVKFYWSPSTWLDDSTKINAWTKPQGDIDYSQYCIDSLGCKSIPNRAYNIHLLNTYFVEEKPESGSKFTFDRSINRVLFENQDGSSASITCYSITGEKVFTGFTHQQFLDLPSLRPGYFYVCSLTIGKHNEVLKFCY